MEVASQSAEPARQLLRRLMAERGYSQRGLAKATEDAGDRVAPQTISNILSGADGFSVRLMEKLARALGEEPTIFSEYRLAQARAELDPDAVGLDQALRTLEAMQRGIQIDRQQALAELDRLAEEREEMARQAVARRTGRSGTADASTSPPAAEESTRPRRRASR